MGLLTAPALFDKAARYCAYRERSQTEVLHKLTEWGATHAQKNLVIAQLQSEQFLDNTRYAMAFARGKFSVNHWGRLKIKAHLAHKGVDSKTIAQALAQIPAAQYTATLQKLITAKKKQLPNPLTPKDKAKLIRYCTAKGYEAGLVLGLV